MTDSEQDADDWSPVDDALLEALVAAGVDENSDEDTLRDMIVGIARDRGDQMLVELEEDAPNALRQQRREEAGFQRRLRLPWGPAIDLLETLLHATIDVGQWFDERNRAQAVKTQDLRFEALIRLHARAAQVTWEILTLLKAGLADGAHSRWRTLHEVTVIASFIRQGDNDLAERYLLHHNITRWRSLPDHQAYADRLQTERFTHDEVANIETVHGELVSRFGRDYENDWGWAAVALGVRSPKFRQIERATDLDHWRPYVRMANHAVHAGSQGITFSLMTSDDDRKALAGPSNMGLADPAAGTALTLNIITCTLLIHYPDIESLAVAQAVGRLAVEVNEAFGRAHQVLAASIAADEGQAGDPRPTDIRPSVGNDDLGVTRWIGLDRGCP